MKCSKCGSSMSIHEYGMGKACPGCKEFEEAIKKIFPRRKSDSKFITCKELTAIRQEIIDGVLEAKEAGVPCHFPESVTIEKVIHATTYKATFPIWNNYHPEAAGEVERHFDNIQQEKRNER